MVLEISVLLIVVGTILKHILIVLVLNIFQKSSRNSKLTEVLFQISIEHKHMMQ